MVFMTDNAPLYWNLFTTVFEAKDCRKLLCIWHVFRAWKIQIQTKIASKDCRDVILKYLRLLRLARLKRSFDSYLEEFIKLLTEYHEEDFKEYFLKKYCSEDRLPQWAARGRRGSVINTNMFVESYHRVLKDKYLSEDGQKRRQSFRIDRLISVLKQVFIDKVREQQSKREKGKVTHRLAELHKRHKTSVSIPVSVIERQDDNHWSVISSKEDDRYVVTGLHKECVQKCLRKYRLCGVCAHLYKCSCVDAITQFTLACKHIHKGHSLQHSKEVEVLQNNNSYNDQNAFAGLINVTETENSQETARMLDEIRLCAQKIVAHPDALKRMLEQCREIVNQYGTNVLQTERFPCCYTQNFDKVQRTAVSFRLKVKKPIKNKNSMLEKMMCIVDRFS